MNKPTYLDRNKPLVFMFSGQGSQYFQMGKELFDNNSFFRNTILELDQFAVNKAGYSIVDEIYKGNKRASELFNNILFTHPALFIVQYALAKLLIQEDVKPDYVLGASLGEICACAVSGVLTVEECLDFTLQHAALINQYCPKGAMLAVLDGRSEVDALLKKFSACEVAAISHERHFVISLPDLLLSEVKLYLRSEQILFEQLPVEFPFHSSLIEVSKPYFRKMAKAYSWQAPRLPYISCTTASVLPEFSDKHLWEVIRQPLKIAETVDFVESNLTAEYLDVGTSGTLANTVKPNLKSHKSSRCHSILSPFGGSIDKFANVVSAFKGQNCKLKRGNQVHSSKKTLKVFVFPGQGSQKVGMGADLFDRFSEEVRVADNVLGYSIKELCHHDPRRELNKTQYTQPALFMVNALKYLAHLEQHDAQPDYLLGHSLGEYNALWAAGVFDLETAVRLVKKRGDLMSRAIEGGMAAVLGCDESQVRKILKDNALDSIDVANYNSPSQIVISGPKSDIVKAAPLFEVAGGNYFPLNVSAAFHSRYMQPAMEEFAQYLEFFQLSLPKIPVISNVTARPYDNNNIAAGLRAQICSSVQWTDSIRYLMGKGEIELVELGPGEVLTKLVNNIQMHADPIISDDPPVANPKSGDTASIDVTDIQLSNKFKDSDQSPPSNHRIDAASLGSDAFKKAYGVKYAYASGSMYKAIASPQLVVRMARAGYLSFLGTGGVKLADVNGMIKSIKQELRNGEPFGVNVLADGYNPETEMQMVDLCLEHKVRFIEASAFMLVSPALVKFRLMSLEKDKSGLVVSTRKILAKASRPEVATAFLNPAPRQIVASLLKQGVITQEQAEMASQIAMADDLCTEADSGGHTDMAVALNLIPTIIRLRDEICQRQKYLNQVRVGAAGGIGTPESAAAAYMLGADFVLTGSVNQCTVEAGTSNIAKDMLQTMNIQDTAYAPAGDMFEIGAKVQVLRRGVFFPARANKLYDTWRHYDSLENVPADLIEQIEQKYFQRSVEDVWNETEAYYLKANPKEVEKCKHNKKHKMALIFRWYFIHTMRLALEGDEAEKVNFQIHTGPALGAFNQWVKGTRLEDWRNRHVDEIADKIMSGAAECINKAFETFLKEPRQ